MTNKYYIEMSLENEKFNLDDLLENDILDFTKIIPMPNDIKTVEDNDNKSYIVTTLFYDYIRRAKVDKPHKEFYEKMADTIKTAASTENVTIFDDPMICERYRKLVGECVSDHINLGERYLSNYMKYGAMSWKYWTRDHWTCEGNPETIEVKPERLTFTCKKDIPDKVFKAISRLYKDHILYVRYSTSKNKGEIKYKNGELLLLSEPKFTPGDDYQKKMSVATSTTFKIH